MWRAGMARVTPGPSQPVGMCTRGADTDKVIKAEECAHNLLVTLHHHVYPRPNALVHQLWGRELSAEGGYRVTRSGPNQLTQGEQRGRIRGHRLIE